jgi:GT2 family glycosyltransferase
MQLSVIIVNYNVKYFIEQCLHSVEAAIKNIDAEVFVVDNNSVDGSCAMLKEKFSWVNLIENKKNVGFSIANNQGIVNSKGKYVLLLNPDTIVEEHTFEKIIQFMDSKPDAGGLGVKMIDGKGNFLPESKRSLPTPMVAFFKIFGFSKLFPKSKTFAKYHLGYLDKNKIHEVDVLSGAFMLLRKETLDKIGLLDETFFMYGEDVDLSYRITQGGYKNYYFPETTIIHYKGESTKKGSLNYVMVFYNAMIIFANKHFSKQNAKIYTFLIKSAIYFKAFLAIISRLIKSIWVPTFDAISIFLGFYVMHPIWANFKFQDKEYYPDELIYVMIPLYISLWIVTIFFSGGYEKPLKINNLFKGILIGAFSILIFYSLLSENYRFSRALILFGTIWTIIILPVSRYIFHYLKLSKLYSSKQNKKVIIVGNVAEAERVSEIISKTDYKPIIKGFVAPDTNGKTGQFIGNVSQLKEMVEINNIEEVIFCAKDVGAKQIIKHMLNLADLNIDYKIASQDSLSVIGSNSIHTSGELYTINLNSISKTENKRNKRLFGFLISIFFLISYPILIFFIKKPLKFLGNIFMVLIGEYAWVGYAANKNFDKIQKLPLIKKGVISPLDSSKNKDLSPETIDQMNTLYAKDYSIFNDLQIIFNGFKNLGN